MPLSRFPRGSASWIHSPLSVLSWILLVAGGPAFAGDYEPLDTIDLLGADPVSSNPYGLAFHPTEPLLYVALSGLVAFPPDLPEDFNGSSVVEIHLGTLQVVRTFEVGLFPTEIAIAPDASELYVTNSTSQSISIVSLADGIAESVPLVDSGGLPVSFPSGIEVSPDGSQLWITSNGGSFDGSNENVLILDRVTRQLVDTVTVVGGLTRFAVRPDGRLVLPVGFPDEVFPSEPQVRIYDTTVGDPWTEIASLTLSVDTADFPGPVDVALSTDGSTAYVTVLGGSSDIFVVDVDAGALLPAISLPGSDFTQHGVAVTDDGESLLVTDLQTASVRVVDLASGAVTHTLPTGEQPNAIVLRGGRAWISDQAGISVSVILLPGGFVRGDANGDGGLGLADGIGILSFLFLQESLPCVDTADFDDDGNVQLPDAVALFQYLFQSGSPPAYPFPQPGTDLVEDDLECDR